MEKFAHIEGAALKTQGAASAQIGKMEQRFTDVDRRLEGIEGELKLMRQTIESIWKNMAKRKHNGDE